MRLIVKLRLSILTGYNHSGILVDFRGSEYMEGDVRGLGKVLEIMGLFRLPKSSYIHVY